MRTSELHLVGNVADGVEQCHLTVVMREMTLEIAQHRYVRIFQAQTGAVLGDDQVRIRSKEPFGLER